MEHADQSQWLARAQLLAEHIQQGNDDEVNRLLDEISRNREQMLFQELGKLTREFHNALNGFRLDAKISQLAQENIPDAKQRLNYVIVMTEQAATRTLVAVEGSLPLCERIATQARALREQWLRFTQRTLTSADFRNLSRDLESFLDRTAEDSDRVRDNLSEVLMAQDFQDITGQILQRVIRLVNEMEEHLVRLVKGSSGHRVREVSAQPSQQEQIEESTVAAHGPYVPGTDVVEEEVIHSQDDVDALLSSLGF
ncbi:Protein phosphatase CheZ [Gammaproteobacteria bacterium]